jgi:hypothetical protein
MENKKMKKIFLTFLLIVSFLTIYSQPVFYKAYDISFGTREDLDSPIEWIVKNKEVQILIAYEDDKIKVYANETQIYRMVKQVSSFENSTTWLMLDENGKKCNAEIGFHSETKLHYTKIEYTDTVILYFTIPN